MAVGLRNKVAEGVNLSQNNEDGKRLNTKRTVEFKFKLSHGFEGVLLGLDAELDVQHRTRKSDPASLVPSEAVSGTQLELILGP